MKRTNEFGLSKEKSKGFYSTSGFKGKKCQYVNSNMQTFTSTKSSFISSRRKGKKEERKERKKTKLKLTDDSFKLSESSCFESESKSEWMKGIVNKSLLKWQERK